MEELIIKTLSDAPFAVIAFYALFNINKNLSRLADTVDRLERRIERLEDKFHIRSDKHEGC